MIEGWTYWIIHVGVVVAIVAASFDSVVMSVAIIVLIFSNLGVATSHSAYSVFNKGFQHMLGDVRADVIDDQLRGGTGLSRNAVVSNEILDIPSKYMNRPCPCGSGNKAKKCCAMRPSRPGVTQGSKRKVQDNQHHEFDGFQVVG